MPSSREYAEFILEQCSGAEVSARKMMGEYALYYRGKVFGLICDDRFLIKPVEAARALLPDAALELPYEGGRPMLLVDRLDDRAFLAELVAAVAAQLPEPRAQKAKAPRKLK